MGQEEPGLRIGNFVENLGSACAIVGAWCCIVLYGFHILGVMGLFLLADSFNWTSVIAWSGCVSALASSFITNELWRLRVLFAGATLLLLTVVWAIVNGAIVSTLMTGWPFGLLWLRLRRRLNGAAPAPPWMLAAAAEKQTEDDCEEDAT